MAFVYNPIPPHTWTRVRNQCLTTSGDKQMNTKAHVLQHNQNRMMISKKQQYSKYATTRQQLAQCATQSDTYTNPNSSQLERVNYKVVKPNTFFGQPNNISGPFQTKVNNPTGCTSDNLISGGVLLCGTRRKAQCNVETNVPYYNFTNQPEQYVLCFPASASDVPGNGILCWTDKIKYWKPTINRRIMNTSSSTQAVPIRVACIKKISG